MVSPLELAQKTYGKLVTHGKSTTISTFVDVFTPSTGLNVRTPTNYTVQTSPYLEYESQYVDNDLILKGDMRIIFANYGLAFTPVNGMKVDSVWFVESVKSHYYQESVVAYELQLRKT